MAEGGGEQHVTGDASAARAALGVHANTADVFISYASTDKAAADSICDALEHGDVTCWIAPRDVKPGAQYADAIVGAINEAKAVVLVLSQSAMASSHVAREVERAASKHKPIIAFRIDGSALNRALEYFLSNSQWIDVSALGMPTALTKLAEAVGQGPMATAKQIPATKRAGRTKKRIAIAAAIIVCLGAVAVVGVHFWSLSHRAAQPAVAIIDKSIAVLPFTDLSEKKDQEYFADGMAEEVIDLLAKLPGVRVIGRTSSFQFKGKNEDLRTIGSTLGAAYVVEGSVRKSGERLRVTAQLIGAQNGSHLWSETYDEDVGDVLKVQDRIAAGLVRALQVTVGADDMQPRPALNNVEAYDLYLRGRHAFDRFDKGGLENAVSYFQQALELEPNFIRAAEWLAMAHDIQPAKYFVPARDGYALARVSTERALKLNPNSGMMLSLRADIHAVYDWDWAAAAEDAKRALELEPRNSVVLINVSRVYASVGRWDDAVRALNASLALDPLFPRTYEWLGFVRERTGQLAEAETAHRKVLEISPTFNYGHFSLGSVLLAQGKVEAALAEMQQEVPEGSRDEGLAIAYYAMGRKAESDAALERYEKEFPSDAVGIAEAYAYRGEADKAFEWLDRAYDQKHAWLYMIKGNPLLKNLERDPRYKAFLHKMNLPE